MQPMRALGRGLAERRAYPGNLTARLIDALLEEGSFLPGLEGMPGFTSRVQASGAVCLRNPAQLVGAVLEPHRARLILALPDHDRLAQDTLSTLIAARFGVDPVWRGRDTGGRGCTLVLWQNLQLDLVVEPGRVDPLFIGSALPGCEVMLQVRMQD